MTVGSDLDQGTPAYEEHIGGSRQYWRDIILGVNDGLVSMLLLVVGVVGGGLTADQVLLTAVVGAIAGAVSMGAGEFLATQSQDEVLSAELKLETVHIKYHRADELAQLRQMFSDMGLADDDLDGIVSAFDRSDEAMLNAMKVLEFGIIDSERRSPYTAMAMSGALFLVGAATSVLPFLFTNSTTVGLWWAAVLTAVGLYAVGVVKSVVTRTSSVRSGLENMSIAGLGAAVAWWVGNLIKTGIS